MRLFVEIGFKALWPVIFFVPWLFIGIAYLLAPLLRWHSRPATIHRTHRKGMGQRGAHASWLRS